MACAQASRVGTREGSARQFAVMSEQSQGPDWWQASDGKWYPAPDVGSRIAEIRAKEEDDRAQLANARNAFLHKAGETSRELRRFVSLFAGAGNPGLERMPGPAAMKPMRRKGWRLTGERSRKGNSYDGGDGYFLSPEGTLFHCNDSYEVWIEDKPNRKVRGKRKDLGSAFDLATALPRLFGEPTTIGGWSSLTERCLSFEASMADLCVRNNVDWNSGHESESPAPPSTPPPSGRAVLDPPSPPPGMTQAEIDEALSGRRFAPRRDRGSEGSPPG